MSTGVASRANTPSAHANRRPRKIASASGRRYPACTSRSRSFESSLADFGTRSPSRLRKSAIWRDSAWSSSAGGWPPTTSRRRRSMATELEPSSRYATAVTPSVPNANASSGSTVITLHLDLDDPLDPDPSDHLHRDRHGNHHLAHRVLEQQLHVLWIDERE